MPSNSLTTSPYQSLLATLRKEIQSAQVEIERRTVLTYWTVGGRINTFLKDSSLTKQFNQNIFTQLSEDLNMDRQVLLRAAQFNRIYPQLDKSLPLNWSQYRYLCELKTDKERRLWEKRIVRERLTYRDFVNLINEKKFNQHSVTKLIAPIRGVLYNYRIIQSSELISGPDVLFIDCGFENYIDPPESNVKIQNGRVYSSLKENEVFTLRSSEAKRNELYTYKAFIERIIDADTLLVMVDCGFGIHHRETLRLRLIDAPEMTTMAGRHAAKWVAEQLKDCPFVVVKTYKTDKYARYLVDVFYLPKEADEYKVAKDGIYLNSKMIEEGIAKIWTV